MRILFVEDDIPIMKDAVELFRPLAEERKINMAVQGSGSVRLLSDRRKLQRVLGNLLDNSIKFTPPGGTVSVSVTGDGSQVVIEVRDTGAGISEEDLPRVFDRFFRAEKSRSEPGNGLGLSLAKAFVTSLGGSITATSGEGSTFRVMLPRRFSPERVLER